MWQNNDKDQQNKTVKHQQIANRDTNYLTRNDKLACGVVTNQGSWKEAWIGLRPQACNFGSRGKHNIGHRSTTPYRNTVVEIQHLKLATSAVFNSKMIGWLWRHSRQTLLDLVAWRQTKNSHANEMDVFRSSVRLTSSLIAQFSVIFERLIMSNYQRSARQTTDSSLVIAIIPSSLPVPTSVFMRCLLYSRDRKHMLSATCSKPDTHLGQITQNR